MDELLPTASQVSNGLKLIEKAANRRKVAHHRAGAEAISDVRVSDSMWHDKY